MGAIIDVVLRLFLLPSGVCLAARHHFSGRREPRDHLTGPFVVQHILSEFDVPGVTCLFVFGL